MADPVDIVSRLRVTGRISLQTRAEAADTIVRLRASCEGMRTALREADGWLEADDEEEVPDPSNLRRGLRARIRTALTQGTGKTEG